MPRQENTKEKILECAFALFSKPRASEISLGEIAESAGISKTAIFRHYKNKDDLLDKMRERFFEAFAGMVSEIEGAGARSGTVPDAKIVEKIVKCVFDFAEEYPNYLGYFLQTSFYDERLSEGARLLLQDGGMNPVSEDIFLNKKNMTARNLVSSYFEMTLVACMILYGGCGQEEPVIVGLEEYEAFVSRLIYSGLGKRKNPISIGRKKELDELCRITLERSERENRFLDAFASLLQENRGSRITIEKIAAALGMAKSSVYSFFKNKRDYLVNMFVQENERAGRLILEKCRAAKSPEEALYVLMRAQANYFLSCPEVIVLHGYFIFQENALSSELVDKVHGRMHELLGDELLMRLLPQGFAVFSDNGATAFIKWVSGLIVGFTLMGTKWNLPAEWQDFYVWAAYEFIQCGIKSVKDGE